MSYVVQHQYRFDAQGKLDADDWLVIPRSDLAPSFQLDDVLAQTIVRFYFDAVAEFSILPIQVIQSAQSAQLRAPFGKTALIFAESERVVDARRAETSWQIAGGFLLAHRVNYGGRFYLGAEWQTDALKLYAAIRRYPPRVVNNFGIARGTALYRQTQERIHRRVQEKFLQRLAAHITHRAER